MLQSRKQIGKVTERKLCIQTAGDVQFGCAFGDCLGCDFQTVVDVVRVSIRLARRAKEPAKLSIGVTDVRRVQVAIDVEVRGAPVTSTTHEVGEFTERRQIVGRIKRDAVFERESFTGVNARCNLVEFFVV